MGYLIDSQRPSRSNVNGIYIRVGGPEQNLISSSKYLSWIEQFEFIIFSLFKVLNTLYAQAYS